MIPLMKASLMIPLRQNKKKQLEIEDNGKLKTKMRIFMILSQSAMTSKFSSKFTAGVDLNHF